MEKMPFVEALHTALPAMEYPAAHDVTTSDWRQQLPVLAAGSVTLRGLRTADARSLHALLTTEEVARFISPPPTSVEGFERFIAWAHAEQAAGRYACFAVVPAGTDTAVGIFQVRQLDAAFDSAEWGFVLGSPLLGHRALHRRRQAGRRLRRRDHRRAPSRSACRRRQRSRQRRARQGRRGARSRAAAVLRLQRPALRPAPLVDPGRRLACGAHGTPSASPLVHRPPPAFGTAVLHRAARPFPLYGAWTSCWGVTTRYALPLSRCGSMGDSL